MKQKPAIFLDRDGTLNEEMGYINHPDRLVLLPAAGAAVKEINELGFLAIIISNQAGLARGYFTTEVLEKVNKKLLREIRKQGGKIDALYFCPHHPEGKVKEFARDCNCRKPKTGLIEKALEDFNIDMKMSYLVGDRYRDIQFGKKLNIRTVLVLTGYGLGEWENDRKDWQVFPDHVSKDLLSAVKWIKQDYKKRLKNA